MDYVVRLEVTPTSAKTEFVPMGKPIDPWMVTPTWRDPFFDVRSEVLTPQSLLVAASTE